VRRLRDRERPSRRLEDAALDLFAFGRVRSGAEMAERFSSVTAERARRVRALLAVPASAAIARKSVPAPPIGCASSCLGSARRRRSHRASTRSTITPDWPR
jgi:hypothetical protein